MNKGPSGDGRAVVLVSLLKMEILGPVREDSEFLECVGQQT